MTPWLPSIDGITKNSRVLPPDKHRYYRIVLPINLNSYLSSNFSALAISYTIQNITECPVCSNVIDLNPHINLPDNLQLYEYYFNAHLHRLKNCDRFLHIFSFDPTLGRFCTFAIQFRMVYTTRGALNRQNNEQGWGLWLYQYVCYGACIDNLSCFALFVIKYSIIRVHWFLSS